ncbi:ribonuclease HI family protein [Candidatus Parcubacteria bacterium]|nr:ribonuclease HI family protein [Patescibacteria group bacterium]MBU4347009.1 ribonuclease HI family protein [Patescibacteria group bacterium]MCG2690996.1 ribonuclease HI family protein [Candidatus Parcubacteria bacterium]
MKYSKLTIYTDGGARNNPGPAGIGAVFYNENKEVIAEISEYIGLATNNQAEYKALLAAIEKAKKLGAEELEFYLDSELVVKQLNREYRVKDKNLAPLFVKIYNATMGFKKVTFKHIPREMNKEADRLVNLAIDKGLK